MSVKTIIEPQTTIPVYDECDVLVVGGGAAGHSAAVAAARAGCKNVILMERYGYCGGDVTGGFVLYVPNLSFYNMTYVRGIQEEWFTRLKKIPGAVSGPGPELAGSRSKNLMRNHPGATTRVKPEMLCHSFNVEPNQLKIEMDIMLNELSDSIRVMYHSWGCKPIMEGNVCKGVYFESKEGRKAVLAKIVIDATGDADICRLSGAPTTSSLDEQCRCGSTALVYRIGGFSLREYREWRRLNPELAKELSDGVAKIHGFRAMLGGGPTDDVSISPNWQPNMDCSTVKDSTATELGTRIKIREVLDWYKECCPIIFHDAYLYDIAPQLGTRGSHRIVGEYIIDKNDWAFPKQHDDCIAWHCTVETLNDNAPIEIPYRSILTQKVDNLLAPGRHISADKIAIDNVNLIPQCVGTGQAAGVAAAVAVATGATTHTVDIRRVQDILAGEQDVPLPRNPHTPQEYTDCLVEHEYGLYTEPAKAAIAAGEAGAYRHWSITKGSGDPNKKPADTPHQ